MKKVLDVEIKRPGLWMDGEVTYGQVGHWFGHTSRDLKMDVIYPHEGQDKPWPCIVWICGGAWIQMDYHAHVPNMIELARQGFVIASVEYRDSNHTPFPGQLEDIKKAIRYLRAHANRYQIDVNNIGVMGESAGGHLAAIVGTTSGTTAFDTGEYLEYSSSVQAACPWYVPSEFGAMPAYDNPVMKGLSPEIRLLGVDPEEDKDVLVKATPSTYIDEKTPPFLLIHGKDDSVVPFNQSEFLYDALEEKKIPVDLIAINGADHADQHFFQEVIVKEIISFFEQTLKRG